MKRSILALGALALTSTMFAAPTPETLTGLGEVRALTDKVKSFQANLEVTDKQGSQEIVTTSTLLVSKEHGWKIDSSSGGMQFQFVSDFTNFYQVFPQRKEVLKSVADTPEAKALFRKPVTDLNPLSLLDPASLNLKGKLTLADEPVYHFEGTTSTQYLPQGKPVVRRMEAWISTQDGLPRKTVEKVEGATGTTIYTSVQVNPTVAAKNFEFVPPPDYKLIDPNQPMRLEAPAGPDPRATTATPGAPSEESRP